jgi:rhamnulokinase
MRELRRPSCDDPPVVAAVDIGASGGRVIAARVSGSGVELHEVSRFPNEPVLAGGTLYWDILRLYGSVLAGLSATASAFDLASAGIDSWAWTTACLTPPARC